MRKHDDINSINETSGVDKTFSEVSPSFIELIRNVYLWMAFGLTITGITAYIVAADASLFQLLFGNSIVFYGLLIAELALVIATTLFINKLSLATATLLFVLYAVVNGVTMAAIFMIYTQESIATVFLITAGTFSAMSLYGYTTGRDLSTMGRMLQMGLIGLVIATIVNLFLQSDRMTYYLSYAGIIIFVGLTAYDTQKIKRWLTEAEEITENNQKLALLGALTLYLDFINLFLYLLRLLGKRK